MRVSREVGEKIWRSPIPGRGGHFDTVSPFEPGGKVVKSPPLPSPINDELLRKGVISKFHVSTVRRRAASRHTIFPRGHKFVHVPSPPPNLSRVSPKKNIYNTHAFWLPSQQGGFSVRDVKRKAEDASKGKRGLFLFW